MAKDTVDGEARRAAYDAAMRGVRHALADAPPRQDFPEDAAPDHRRVYWMLREVAARMTMQIAASRRKRAEEELRDRHHQEHGEGLYPTPASPASIARERGDTQLDAIERRLDDVERRVLVAEQELALLRGRAATRAETESVKDDIRIAAEGHAVNSVRLEHVDARLERIDDD